MNQNDLMTTKYMILSLFKHWYMNGKTEATAGEVYKALNITIDSNTPGYSPDALFYIDKNILELEDELLSTGIRARLN